MRVFLGLSLLLFGCGDTQPAPSETALPEEITSEPDLPMTLSEVPSLDVRGHGGAPRSPVRDRPSPEERQQMMEDMMAAGRFRVDLSARLANAPDWRAMEAAADEIVPQIPESMRHAAQADAAERIVRRIVALPAPTPADFDALGEYTNELIWLRSAEGDDILRALIRLEGTWDSAEIAGTARSAARTLGAHFTEQAGCVGCTVEEALGDMMPQRRQSLDPYLYEVQVVHRELMRLARSASPR